jgi:hypothetical protein
MDIDEIVYKFTFYCKTFIKKGIDFNADSYLVEIEVASGGPRGTIKSWKINLNAKVNYALAA